MNIKTYVNKSNTIICNSEINTGKNPVLELYYGDGFTRILINIDTDKIKNFIEDKTFSDMLKLKHVLKMKNAWGLQSISNNTLFNSGKDSIKERTSSFDLYLLRMPEKWDSGIGSDFTKDGFITSNYVYSENGSNWYTSSGYTSWIEGPGAISGITDETHPYFIKKQHFNDGIEDIELDITSEINSIINSGITNNGFMICFPTIFEQESKELPQYVGFISNNSSTFYKPYLETIYDENIIDDRNHFYSNKLNRLYLYSIIGGSYTNLDSTPNCSINGTYYTVKQATKGVYYVEIPASDYFSENEMYYDLWSGIVYNGKIFNDIEKEFVVKPQEEYFNFTDSFDAQIKYIPNIYGIKLGSNIVRGDIIKLFIEARIEYSKFEVYNITGMEYRLYVKDLDKELTVIDYQPVNRALNNNYFLLDTESLLPNKYFIDIKINKNNEEITYKSKLMFNIIDNI